MTRLALAIVVTAATGVGIAAHHKRPAPAASAQLASVIPLRASRAQERQPLPGVKAPRVVHPGQGASRPVSVRRARPASGGELLDVTAYCATGHRTASGMWPRIGMAAGNRWPFGTVLRIAGLGQVVVEDRIGWGSDVDLYYGDGADCASRASEFGRRRLLVTVVS